MELFKRKNIRINLDDHDQFMKLEYKRAVSKAREHIDIEGVEDYLKHAQDDFNAYVKKLWDYVESERPTESKKYGIYEEHCKKHNKFVWIGLGLLLFYIVSGIAGLGLRYPVANALSVIRFLILLFIIVDIVVIMVMRIIVTSSAKNYDSYAKEVLSIIGGINSGINMRIAFIVDDVDQMYLATLDQMTLQIVLMRRELNAANKKNEELQKAIVDEQRQIRKLQERTEDEQKRSRQIQQGILDNMNEWRDERHNRY